MKRTCILVVAIAAGAAAAQPACARQAPAQESAQELYRTGRYEDAIRALQHPSDDAARRLLVRALLEVGRYDDASSAALGDAAVSSVPAELANVAGEALYARGRRAEAEQAFARAATSNAPDALRARLNLAVAKWDRGARAEALREFDAFIDIYNEGRARTAEELTAVAVAVSYLGVTDPQLFHDAVDAFEEAAKADPRYADARLLEGELFLEKYNSTDAAALFREVLAYNPRQPRAWLGLARAKAFDGTDEALAYVDSSLAVNPNSPQARAFRALTLLALENFDGAAAEAERALAIDPADIGALGTLGAVRYLRGDQRGYDELRARALGIDPHAGRFDIIVAEAAAQHRRYREALELAQRGLALDSTHWGGHALVGLTELRLGSVERAKASLDIAFAGDPYNVWVKNTLDLLDTYPKYVTRTTNRFELFLHGTEADLLELYMGELAEEALDKLIQRYGVRPELPIRVEVYPRHADFSVRSVGLAGLGALGVAFGNILALDSPSARAAGDMNWGATLWHEIAHTITLAASEHRVPRWLTEGLSVLEERRAREGWGDDVTIDFVAALKTNQLPPVSDLNSGFVRPKYPQQIMHAYYQASLVAELIEREHGERALRDMLRAYKEGKTNEQVFRDVLRTDMKSFDARFDAYIRQKFARQLTAIEVPARIDYARGPLQISGEFADAMAAARAHLEAQRFEDARREAARARAAFPEYAGVNGPYRLLYEIAKAGNDGRGMVEALRAHTARNETDYEAHLLLGELLAEQGDRAGAAAVLERAMYIYPFDPKVHERLADHFAALKQHPKAVRERRAVVALAPANRADALYRLAVALADAGERAEARRQVLRALEIAPNFTEAQELLLRVRGGS